MTALQALDKFWNGFGLVAYDENTVPDNAILPYITYEASKGFFNESIAMSASIWYHSSSWAGVTTKEEQISDFIGRGGRMISFDGGAFWISKGTPWAQRMSDPSDEMIRRVVLNVEVEFIQ